MLGLSGGDVATAAAAFMSMPSMLGAAYFKLRADQARASAATTKQISEAEIKFRDTLIAQEARCREENHTLRNELTATQSRLMIVERAKIFAEANLEVAKRLDAIGNKLGIEFNRDQSPPAIAG